MLYRKFFQQKNTDLINKKSQIKSLDNKGAVTGPTFLKDKILLW